jgi:hypothetical protein
MPDRSSVLLSRFIIAIALLLPHTVAAQSARWFQVELLVFSDSTGANAEQWEATPDLDYPGASHFLVDPARAKNDARQHSGGSRVDESGQQSLTASRAGKGSFTTLPRTQLAFRGKAPYMQKTGRYRILFHEAWVQPIGSRSRALPIVLDRSGDEMQWPELQGPIKLYLSRYLHLETNLWMNTDGEYLHGTWSMPPPPLGPLSGIVEKPIHNKPDPVAAVNVYDLHTQQEPLRLEEESDEELGPVYPFRHAVLHKQKRRMRSGEVHYIDHPMLGVIVKVTPVGA